MDVHIDSGLFVSYRPGSLCSSGGRSDDSLDRMCASYFHPFKITGQIE